MDKSIVKGYEKLKNDFGYYPVFHDDIIDKIEFSNDGIILYIDMQTLPQGMTSYPKVKLSFYDVKDFNINGELYGCVSIIFEIHFEKIGELIKTDISSSLGVSGIIHSKIVEIELINLI